MTDSVFIRLAGPLQSWAKPAITGNYVHTNEIPTASALRGLIAGGLGYQRNHWPEWIQAAGFEVRVDSDPTLVDDFHTIGSREDEYEFRRRLAIMQGLKASSAKQLAFKPGVGATVIAKRTYLADAEFIVRITCEGHTEEIDKAVSAPVFSTYLGRKAFPAHFPFYLGLSNADMLKMIPAISDTRNSKTEVPLHSLGMGPTARPSRIPVPAVKNRDEWFAELAALNLQRRAAA
ncbi:type I-E CRISPR-associated protein Cas5/CasD [Corynebacterium yudongzhengii]|uniref:Type I-E CRISPR-associated protein Cas5/CasD n=1 Tax=Corynebacterium yudongzhengii TaxID=2080740 RepID=A0A2U1T408_9CORY|nr:type I-E CRISPR-associated protein Cas5/CasD [Corynebacterium yudongzhengii]AWB82406.1 type I-E CRISPR-associated protein Cas5/CasD [Corynebacterium yudongzhengii]PWC00740.1 type I-E CRISPR-associated protein Cas5/CasD [Corynebacterium yudongzhengii]